MTYLPNFSESPEVRVFLFLFFDQIVKDPDSRQSSSQKLSRCELGITENFQTIFQYDFDCIKLVNVATRKYTSGIQSHQVNDNFGDLELGITENLF